MGSEKIFYPYNWESLMFCSQWDLQADADYGAVFLCIILSCLFFHKLVPILLNNIIYMMYHIYSVLICNFCFMSLVVFIYRCYRRCDKECCHMFTYGSGSKIGQNAKATLCADSESVTFYTQNDEAFWAQIHVDPALPTITRPTVQFCFKHVEYCEFSNISFTTFLKQSI